MGHLWRHRCSHKYMVKHIILENSAKKYCMTMKFSRYAEHLTLKEKNEKKKSKMSFYCSIVIKTIGQKWKWRMNEKIFNFYFFQKKNSHTITMIETHFLTNFDVVRTKNIDFLKKIGFAFIFVCRYIFVLYQG